MTHRPIQDRDLRISQQVQDLAGIQVSDVLGADHDDRIGWADQPQQLLVQIGRAWWQVHQQLVQLTLGDASQELVQHHLDQRRRNPAPGPRRAGTQPT